MFSQNGGWEKYMVFQNELYKGIPNATVSNTLNELVDSLYAFKYTRLHNARHRVTFGIPL
jgi:hypothetical protein